MLRLAGLNGTPPLAQRDGGALRLPPTALEELAAARDSAEAEDSYAAAAPATAQAGAALQRSGPAPTLGPGADVVEADEILLEGQQQEALSRPQEPPSEISR